jgi:2-isopropylmalate synthase
MWDIFASEYLTDRRLVLRGYTASTGPDGVTLAVDVTVDGEDRSLTGAGNGPIDAFVRALSDVGIEVQVLDYAEHALTSGENARAAAYVECSVGGQRAERSEAGGQAARQPGQVRWGVGIDENIVTASLRGIASAVNR